MPKSTVEGGPSNAGFVDTPSDTTAAPGWVPSGEAAEIEPAAPAEPRTRKVTRRGAQQKETL